VRGRQARRIAATKRLPMTRSPSFSQASRRREGLQSIRAQRLALQQLNEQIEQAQAAGIAVAMQPTAAAAAAVVAPTVAPAAASEAAPAPASVAVASQEEQATEVAVLRAKTPKRHPSKPYGRVAHHSPAAVTSAPGTFRAKTPGRPATTIEAGGGGGGGVVSLRSKTPDVPRAKTPSGLPSTRAVAVGTKTPSRGGARASRLPKGGKAGFCGAAPICADSPSRSGAGGGGGGGEDGPAAVMVPSASTALSARAGE